MTAPPAPIVERPADPALGLVQRLVGDALDPAYRAAAERPGRSRGGWAAALGLVMVGLVLALAATDQVVGSDAAADRKQELAASVQRVGDQVGILEARVSAVDAEVTELRDRALARSTAGSAASAGVVGLAPDVGAAPVVGPAVVVTLDDAPPDEAAARRGEPDLGRILDRDLQVVVNGLWTAGSEAIAINGQRLTALSAIRGAGDAILVNYRPLVRPYVVTAVGDPMTLPGRLASSPAGEELAGLREAYGLRYEVTVVEQAVLPAGPTSLQLARPVVQP